MISTIISQTTFAKIAPLNHICIIMKIKTLHQRTNTSFNVIFANDRNISTKIQFWETSSSQQIYHNHEKFLSIKHLAKIHFFANVLTPPVPNTYLTKTTFASIRRQGFRSRKPFSFFPQKRETEKARRLVKTQSLKDAES